jgi:NAD(P)-dependent dehydrogenase (short-subunit alcohol dehydrogenase family)
MSPADAPAPAASSMGGCLAGRVALVTGGGSGIGRAVVERFVAEGARVVIADVDADRLAEVRASHGDRVATLVTDVRDFEQNRAAVELAVRVFGRLDVLVPNAGTGDKFTELADMTGEVAARAFTEVFDVNVKGLVLGVRAALPELVRHRGSVVITLSSSSFWPDGGGVMYVASKHAALGVLRQLAHELAPHVRVNAVAPGATVTGFSSAPALGTPAHGLQAQPGADPEALAASIRARNPMRSLADPSDHTAAYAFLASRELSPVITGTVIESDGGLGIRGMRRVRGGDDLAARLSVEPVAP